jgi:hypothetical protein
MFKHAENTLAANPKTLEFSVRSEFSVGTVLHLNPCFSKLHAGETADCS